ncbi:MAG TPA: arylamine N-acetyltransferase, partial [Pseudomonas sp.]|nr:arylamine N-acetyltransferase [Pseudomonas sp.]
ERRQVADAQELIGLLESEFGIRVPEKEVLTPVLERLIGSV